MEVPKPVRTKKKKRVGQSPQVKLKKECDRLWSKIVRSKNSTCIWCKKRAAVHAHHIISRRFLPTRHAIENGAALCGGCHMMAHQRPDHFIPFIKARLGEKIYEQLRVIADIRASKPDYGIRLIGLMSEWSDTDRKSFSTGGKG